MNVFVCMYLQASVSVSIAFIIIWYLYLWDNPANNPRLTTHGVEPLTNNGHIVWEIG